MKIDKEITIASRREFLRKLAYGSALVLSGCGIETASVRHEGESNEYTRGGYLRGPQYKSLAFEHAHTGEKLKITYCERGRYIKGALREISYLLRDFRTDDVHPIDPALLDQLFDLKQSIGFNRPFHILSGYRSPITNAQLRKHKHGVAEHSYHMQGRAIDIRVEGIPCKTIRNTALVMAQGGVGYYPRSNFVHLDTGRYRTW